MILERPVAVKDASFAIPYAGTNQIRFNGYHLRLKRHPLQKLKRYLRVLMAKSQSDLQEMMS